MASQDDDQRSRVSRRRFLKTVGAGGLVAGALTSREARAQSSAPATASARIVGPGEAPIAFTVNGRRHMLRVEPRTTLLDAIRNQLQLTGHKRVCDRGSCGACTMIVDGRAIYSCAMLAIDAQGKVIRTVEGLVSGTVLHPVQKAFCDADGLMCGVCTPGFVVATVSLLEKTPNPTAEQARSALDGGICRCGAYARVLDAALKARDATRG